jgi:hypothetical protein
MAMAQQAGYNLTVNVVSHSFGVSSVDITVTTENGYNVFQNVATPGGASWTFPIPPNQGNSVQVCAHENTLSYILGTSCRHFSINPNGGDQSVSIDAG